MTDEDRNAVYMELSYLKTLKFAKNEIIEYCRKKHLESNYSSTDACDGCIIDCYGKGNPMEPRLWEVEE